MRQGGCQRQHMSRVATVAGEAGNALDRLTGEGVAAAATAAKAAGAAKPAHADPCAYIPARDVRAKGIDDANDLIEEMGASNCLPIRCSCRAGTRLSPCLIPDSLYRSTVLTFSDGIFCSIQPSGGRWRTFPKPDFTGTSIACGCFAINRSVDRSD